MSDWHTRGTDDPLDAPLPDRGQQLREAIATIFDVPIEWLTGEANAADATFSWGDTT